MKTHLAFSQELWEQTPAEVRAYLEGLEARQASLGALEARVVALAALVQTLQAQLTQTSQHSSRPPSRDPPQHSQPRHSRGKRRRGGHPGPPGHTRTLLPVDAVNEIVVLKPAQGSGCHAA